MRFIGMEEQKKRLVLPLTNPAHRSVHRVIEAVHRVDQHLGARDARTSRFVDIEPAAESVERIELNPAVERSGLVSLAPQDLGESERARIDSGASRDGGSMVARKERGEDRSVGGKGRGCVRDRLLEESRGAAEGIDARRGVPRIAVATQMISAKRVDGNQDNIGRRVSRHDAEATNAVAMKRACRRNDRASTKGTIGTIRKRTSAKLRWKPFAVAAFSISIAACRSQEIVSHDLVELLPSATVTPETSFIDFGSEAARTRLRAGFSADETSGDGTTFVWSEGAGSELELFVSEPRALALTVRCWPFSFPGAPRQKLSFFLNGEPFAEVELAAETAEYRVTLPVARVLAGENLLQARYGYSRAVKDVFPGAADGRRLAVAWDWLRVEGALPVKVPAALGEGEESSLMLPAGTRLEFFVTAPARARLEIDGVHSEASSALTVVVDTLSNRVEQRSESPAGRVSVELPTEGELTRIALQAGSLDLTLRRPAVVAIPEAEARAPAVGEPKPNVIVYLIDTLRADHLGCYGYSKPTPNIDRLAADGTLFERALAQSSWTRPATASILTGFHPRAHTANEREDALPAAVPTLAEELADIGYETAGLVVNANVSAPFGFDRGFETFELLLHEDGILGASGDSTRRPRRRMAGPALRARSRTAGLPLSPHH